MKKDICDHTFAFSVLIVKLGQFLDDKSEVAKTLAQQLLKSGTSIGANLGEAQAAQRKAYFISKLMITLPNLFLLNF
ncbi:four helix bundle protein [Nostoc sp. FACHB-110]|uniref:four helix bundle protein n=1 Tax=Nostoc sp. FACHB-110 TaxID=2692834 RepID=UPI001683A775|nr:four helix bundle protein [Nostoc sp. FACHB-110]MBD2436910.1 four helix bundle protein [Nostoc sp. FACHB-110]